MDDTIVIAGLASTPPAPLLCPMPPDRVGAALLLAMVELSMSTARLPTRNSPAEPALETLPEIVELMILTVHAEPGPCRPAKLLAIPMPPAGANSAPLVSGATTWSETSERSIWKDRTVP